MAQVNIDATQAFNLVVSKVQWLLTTIGGIVLLTLFCAALLSKVHVPTFSIPILPPDQLMYYSIGWAFATGIAASLFRK